MPLLRAFPRLEDPELLLRTESVVLRSGVLVAVGVVPTVDVAVGEGGVCVGDGEGAREGVLVTVGVTGTGVCPTGVGPPPPPGTLVGDAPEVVIWTGGVGTVFPLGLAERTISRAAR